MKAILLCAILSGGSIPELGAQNLEFVQGFSTYKGNIQLLPGGHVLTEQDRKFTHYVYRSGRFVVSRSPLPEELRHWKSFDWEGADYLDQMDRHAFDPTINDFLPAGRRIKKLAYVSLGVKSQTLILVCYTLKTAEEFASPTSTDIYVTALRRTWLLKKPPIYRKLWERRLQVDVDYGDFVVQEVPGAGRLALLYYVGVGGSGYSLGLDIYRVVE